MSPTGEKCVVTPPSPPSSSKMILVNYSSDNPPSHGETVQYQCNAGPDHNRFSHDYNLWQLSVSCLRDNKFDNVSWPTCLNGQSILYLIFCAFHLFIMAKELL